MAKLVRLTAAVRNDPTINGSRPFPFLFLDGLIADLTPWMQCAGHGTVSGLPNFAPRVGVRLYSLLMKASPSNDELAEAERLQDVLSRADVAAVPAGVRGMSVSLCGDNDARKCRADEVQSMYYMSCTVTARVRADLYCL